MGQEYPCCTLLATDLRRGIFSDYLSLNALVLHNKDKTETCFHFIFKLLHADKKNNQTKPDFHVKASEVLFLQEYIKMCLYQKMG